MNREEWKERLELLEKALRAFTTAEKELVFHQLVLLQLDNIGFIREFVNGKNIEWFNCVTKHWELLDDVLPCYTAFTDKPSHYRVAKDEIL